MLYRNFYPYSVFSLSVPFCISVYFFCANLELCW